MNLCEAPGKRKTGCTTRTSARQEGEADRLTKFESNKQVIFKRKRNY